MGVGGAEGEGRQRADRESEGTHVHCGRSAGAKDEVWGAADMWAVEGGSPEGAGDLLCDCHRERQDSGCTVIVALETVVQSRGESGECPGGLLYERGLIKEPIHLLEGSNGGGSRREERYLEVTTSGLIAVR